MTFLLVTIGGIVGLVAGFAAAAAIALVLAGAMGVSDFEGGRAMVAMFGFGPLGGLAGLFAGVALVLRWRGQRSFGKAIGYGALTVLSIIALAGAAIGIMQMTGDVLRPNQAPLQLEFEIRLPAAATLPPRLGAIKVELQTDKNTMPATLFERLTRQEGGRTVIGGSVDLYFRSSSRLVVLGLPGEPERIFRLALSASPRLSDTYSAWERVALVAQAPSAQPRKAGPDDDSDIRYRVIDPTVAR